MMKRKRSAEKTVRDIRRATRVSSFTYDSVTGLLKQETIDPDLPEFRLNTDYTWDAFGNKVTVTVIGGDIAVGMAITSRDSATTRVHWPLTVA